MELSYNFMCTQCSWSYIFFFYKIYILKLHQSSDQTPTLANSILEEISFESRAYYCKPSVQLLNCINLIVFGKTLAVQWMTRNNQGKFTKQFLQQGARKIVYDGVSDEGGGAVESINRGGYRLSARGGVRDFQAQKIQELGTKKSRNRNKYAFIYKLGTNYEIYIYVNQDRYYNFY